MSDTPARRLYATLAVASAAAILLAVLLFVARPTRLAPDRRPFPVELDDPTGLTATRPTNTATYRAIVP